MIQITVHPPPPPLSSPSSASNSIQNADVLVEAMVRQHALREHDVVQLPEHVFLEVPLHYSSKRSAILETPRLREPDASRYRKSCVILR